MVQTGIEFERATIGRSEVTSEWRVAGAFAGGHQEITLALTVLCGDASAGARWSAGEEAPDCVFGWNQSTGEQNLEQPVGDRVRRVGDRLVVVTPLAWLGPVSLADGRAQVTAVVNRDGSDRRAWRGPVLVEDPC
jgi:hypothetical protein